MVIKMVNIDVATSCHMRLVCAIMYVGVPSYTKSMHHKCISKGGVMLIQQHSANNAPTI